MAKAKKEIRKIYLGSVAVARFYEEAGDFHIVGIDMVGPWESFFVGLFGRAAIHDTAHDTGDASDITPEMLNSLPSGPERGPDMGATPSVPWLGQSTPSGEAQGTLPFAAACCLNCGPTSPMGSLESMRRMKMTGSRHMKNLGHSRCVFIRLTDTRKFRLI